MSVTDRDLDRLESLLTYGVLAGRGPDLSAAVALAARVCGTSAAGIGFLGPEGLHIYAAHGHARTLVARERSLALAAIDDGRAVCLPDVAAALGDDHPVLGGPDPIRAFAAVPLIGRDGIPVGAVAVHHHRPRQFSAGAMRALAQVADGVMTKLELYRLDSWEGRAARPTPLADPVRLRRALDADELVPYFQPIVDLGTGEPVILEALIRWVHPELGIVPPGHFLPTVEASGLMLPVGRRVRSLALEALAVMHRSTTRGSTLRLSVNSSPVELAQQGFAAEVLADLERHGLAPESLVLEVTETAAFVDPEAGARQLRALRDAGVAIALDDYGAGYSSLLRVLSLPLSVLKIDRALVTRLPDDSRLGTVVASTIAMTADLGLEVVAEGVETPLEAMTLQAMGCEMAQGWYFGGVLSLVDTVRTLRPTTDGTTTRPPLPAPRAVAASRAPAPAAYLVDRGRRIAGWSEGAEVLTGYSGPDVLGRQCADGLLAHVDDEGTLLCGAGCPLQATIDDGTPREAHVWLHHRDGHLVPVLVAAEAVRDEAGVVVGAVETFWDDVERASGRVCVPPGCDLAEADLPSRNGIHRI